MIRRTHPGPSAPRSTALALTAAAVIAAAVPHALVSPAAARVPTTESTATVRDPNGDVSVTRTRSRLTKAQRRSVDIARASFEVTRDDVDTTDGRLTASIKIRQIVRDRARNQYFVVVLRNFEDAEYIVGYVATGKVEVEFGGPSGSGVTECPGATFVIRDTTGVLSAPLNCFGNPGAELSGYAQIQGRSDSDLAFDSTRETRRVPIARPAE